MPEVPRRTRLSIAVLAVALVLTTVAPFGSRAFAQAAASSKAGADVFPFAPAWSVTLGSYPIVSPVYDETRAYVVLAEDREGSAASEARLEAYSVGSGAMQWSRPIGKVDAMTAGDDQVFATTGEVLNAFSAADGEPRWQLPLPAPLAAPLHYDAGWLIVVTQASDALAIRARDGARIWQAHLPSPATGEPAVAGDGLYLPLTDNRVFRLALDSGRMVWDRKIQAQPGAVLALGDRVFVGTIRWFYALEPKDGRILWKAPIGAAVVGAPAADPDRVYFLALDNLLRALDRDGGALKWRQILARRERYGPLLVGPLAVVSGISPTIQAYEKKTGGTAGSYDAPDDLRAQLHVLPGIIDRDFLLLALTAEGQLMALRPRSLQPEPFAVSPLACFLGGFPVFRW